MIVAVGGHAALTGIAFSVFKCQWENDVLLRTQVTDITPGLTENQRSLEHCQLQHDDDDDDHHHHDTHP